MKRKKMIPLACLLFLAACSKPAEIPQDRLQVYFFNAGKADASILYTDESAVVIDTGTSGEGKTILRYMQENGIEDIDCLIITHFDKDHVGGAAELIAGTDVKEVLISNSPKDSDEYAAFVQALESARMEAKIITGEEPYQFTLDEVTYTVDGPDEAVYEKDPSNNSSLITSVTYGDTSLLFAADAENLRMNEYLADYESTYDIVKMPYHGWYQKSLKDLLQETEPEYAVISCSAEEGGEEKTLDLLKENGIAYYMAYEGGILMISDGSKITVSQ